jgi:hypothetical protein
MAVETAQTIELDVMGEMLADFQAISSLKTPEEQRAALSAFQTSKDTKVASRLEGIRDTEKANREAKAAAEKDLRDKVGAALKPAWDESKLAAQLKRLAEGDRSVQRLTFYVEIKRSFDADTGEVTKTEIGAPIVTLATKVLSSTKGGGTGRGVNMTVDGKVYASAKAAYEATNPPSPSPMNRLTIRQALTEQGRTVAAD